MYTGAREAVKAIYAHFRACHGREAPTFTARAFRWPSCTECTDGMVVRGETTLTYCECVKQRLRQKAEELVAARRDYGGPDDQVV